MRLNKRLLLLNGLALAGVAISVALTQHFYEVRNGTAGFRSYCDLGSRMNCDLVAASPFAEFFAGIPLSAFAAGWYLALFMVTIIAHNLYWRRESLRAALAMTGIGLVISVAYFVVMSSVLKTYCLLCLITDGIGLLSFGLVLSLKPEVFSAPKPEWSKWKTLLATIAGSLFAAIIALRGLDPLSLSAADINERVDSILGTAPVSVNAGPEFPSIGPSDAPVTLVEFSDFQCPYCRIGAFTINSVLKRFPNQVRLVFRNFPLDPTCNRKMDRPLHAHACEAARTAVCANRQGKFEAVYEEFFDRQGEFSSPRDGIPIEIAAHAGADPKRLESCIKDSDVSGAISRDVEEAILLGVESTPTFFINGRRVDGVMPVQVWTRVIERLLKP